MTKEAARLLEEALQLAPGDRAKVAAELLASLDEADENVHSAWAAEIARRAADADANPDDEEDWRVALSDIRGTFCRGEADSIAPDRGLLEMMIRLVRGGWRTEFLEKARGVFAYPVD